MTVTEHKDAIVALIENLQEEHGVMVEHMHFDWNRHRDPGNAARMAALIDVSFTADLT